MAFLTPSMIKLSYGGSTTEYDLSTGVGGQLTLSDHSRSELGVDYDIIEKSTRMANGTMRKYVVAKKKTFGCSWDMLPTISSQVVDGNANAKAMKAFYETYVGSPLTLKLYYGRNGVESGYEETYSVYWESFGYDVTKRLKNFDYWNVDVEFTEI